MPKKPKVAPIPDGAITFPMGVLIRDKQDRVYFITIPQLEQFRRQDLEARQSLIAEFREQDPIQGLKNAWLIDAIGIRSVEGG